MRKGIYYIFVLILLYLVLIHFTGFGKDLSAVTSLARTSITSLQGR